MPTSARIGKDEVAREALLFPAGLVPGVHEETPGTSPDKYPEHEKLKLISAESQAIGEFLEWLDFGGLEDFGCVELAHYPLFTREDGSEDRSDYLQWIALPKTRILATYFDIDQEKIEAEKRAMLESLEKANP